MYKILVVAWQNFKFLGLTILDIFGKLKIGKFKFMIISLKILSADTFKTPQRHDEHGSLFMIPGAGFGCA